MPNTCVASFRPECSAEDSEKLTRRDLRFASSLIGFDWVWIGFVLGLFWVCFHQVSNWIYFHKPLLLKTLRSFAIRLRRTRLALFCIIDSNWLISLESKKLKGKRQNCGFGLQAWVYNWLLIKWFIPSNGAGSLMVNFKSQIKFQIVLSLYYWANLRVWVEIWCFFDRINRINSLLEKEIKFFSIFGFLSTTTRRFDWFLITDYAPIL